MILRKTLLLFKIAPVATGSRRVRDRLILGGALILFIAELLDLIGGMLSGGVLVAPSGVA